MKKNFISAFILLAALITPISLCAVGGDQWYQNATEGTVTITHTEIIQVIGPEGVPMDQVFRTNIKIKCCVGSNDGNACNASGYSSNCPPPEYNN